MSKQKYLAGGVSNLSPVFENGMLIVNVFCTQSITIADLAHLSNGTHVTMAGVSLLQDSAKRPNVAR